MPSTQRRANMTRTRPCLLGALAAAMVSGPAAEAADRVYWTNSSGTPALQKISFANLDGSGGGDLAITGTSVNGPQGVAFDPAAGRIYWANANTNKISFANLDGSGGGDLNTTGATVNTPEAVVVDAGARRIYWANYDGQRISFASLDGGGGGDLNTGAATVAYPVGVALDLPARRIWWSNSNAPKISFASLDGAGGGDLNTTGATVSNAQGVAFDRAEGRIYWANNPGGISFANLDGSGGRDLTMSGGSGIAIDPDARRIYWGAAVKISFVGLDGSGGGDVNSSGATTNSSYFPVLLKAPSGTGAPTISGGSTPASVLSCSPGSWGSDLLDSHLYRAPQSFAYQWSRDGSPIAGANASSYTAFVVGDYRCQVTASNFAGSGSQTSAPRSISPPAFGAGTLVTLRLAATRIPAGGPLKIRVSNGNDFAITGKLSGQTVNRVSVSSKRRVKLRAKSFRVAAHGRKTVGLRLPAALRRSLRRTGKLKLRLTAKVKDPAGNTRVVGKRLTPRLKKHRQRR